MEAGPPRTQLMKGFIAVSLRGSAVLPGTSTLHNQAPPQGLFPGLFPAFFEFKGLCNHAGLDILLMGNFVLSDK